MLAQQSSELAQGCIIDVEGDTEVNHVSAALGNLAAGQPVEASSVKPWGCSVKYAD